MNNFDGKKYQARFDALAERGVDVHGEAALIKTFDPGSVLDAGCGTGRVAIELSRQGIEVIGVDKDASMIAEARRIAPDLTWLQQDLSTLDLGRTFDVVALAGNVPLFCPEGSRAELVRCCAVHIGAEGVLIAGFELGRGYGLDEYDQACAAAGITISTRWSTWDGRPFKEESGYAVSIGGHAR
jgi:SAM-dependent methyltransferase